MQSLWHVIKGPVVTEKAMTLKEATQDTKQLLTFRVADKANKREIREAVEEDFQGKSQPRSRFELQGQSSSSRQNLWQTS